MRSIAKEETKNGDLKETERQVIGKKAAKK